MNESRGPWYLLTGLIVGLALGLGYAWGVQPVQYTNTRPADLRADFKDQYRSLIAAAYAANGDLVRARERLKLLQDADLYRVLAEQAQRTLAGGASLQEARALGQLAVALGQPPVSAQLTPSPAITSPSPTASPPAPASPTSTALAASPTGSPNSPGGTSVATPTNSVSTRTPRPSATPTQTGTPLPTRTPTPTPLAPFVLESQELLCDPNQPTPLIQVLALDNAGQGLPGVEAVASWGANSESHFFTGLKSELGLGYADFEMTPGETYSLRLAKGGQPVPNLAPTECENSSGARQWGSWKFTFSQP
jgi:hypothetical protein